MNKELQDHVWKHCLPKEFKEEVKRYYQHTDCGSYAEDILESIFGENNLTSDAEGEEMLTVSRKKVQEMFGEAQKTIPTCEHDRGFRNAELTILRTLFGYKCLPDETRDKREKREMKREVPKPAEPKFKVGDKVRIISVHGRPTPYKGAVDVIAHINEGNKEQMYYLENTFACAYGFSESDLEPYTEPKNGYSEYLRVESVQESRIASEESHLHNLSQETANCDKCPKSVQKTHPDFGHSRLTIAAMAMQGMLSNTTRFSSYEISDLVRISLNCADALIKKAEGGSDE